MIVTCSTFALYSSSFTKSASQALSAAESGDGDQAMGKRWDFLKKFESNFNHWYVFSSLCMMYLPTSFFFFFQVQGKYDLTLRHWFLLNLLLQFHLDCVQYYASSENVSLLPLVVRLSSIKSMS